jgi:hypothetical protein
MLIGRVVERRYLSLDFYFYGSLTLGLEKGRGKIHSRLAGSTAHRAIYTSSLAGVGLPVKGLLAELCRLQFGDFAVVPTRVHVL